MIDRFLRSRLLGLSFSVPLFRSLNPAVVIPPSCLGDFIIIRLNNLARCVSL